MIPREGFVIWDQNHLSKDWEVKGAMEGPWELATAINGLSGSAGLSSVVTQM